MRLADGLRLVMHLPCLVRHPLIEKVVADPEWVSHTAKSRARTEL